MRILKEIVARITVLWGLVWFIATMLVFMVPFLLFCVTAKDPLKTKRFILYARIWMAVYLPLIGCPLTVRGKKHFAPGETYIVVCNHNSLLDIPITTPAIPGGNKTIAKIEMAKIPLFGLIYRTGSVLVDRKSESSRKESYGNMKKVLEMGLHMCIYPEGTRNLTNEPLKSFHDGAFRLAVDSGKAIIPGIVFNTRKAVPTNKSFYLLPHRLEMHFLPPVPVTAADTTESLKNKVRAIMEAYYVANNK
jgi:1-acyl-sn-glycerol-3-phosphate acyltransferase